jgi:hypothetical protein
VQPTFTSETLSSRLINAFMLQTSARSNAKRSFPQLVLSVERPKAS